MPLIAIVIVLIVLALAIYGVQRFIPGEPMLKNVICAVLVFAVILWLLSGIGFLDFRSVG